MKAAQTKAAVKKRPRRNQNAPFTIKTILVPTDFSARSLKALKYGRALAKQFRAQLHLMSVFDARFIPSTLLPHYATDDRINDRLTRRLRGIAAKHGVPARGQRCHARIGRAFDEICGEAQRLRADLIVLATHGHSGLKHLLLGSTAERVVQHAPCPVLVVREKGRHFLASSGRPSTTLRLRHILVPIDFSSHSRVALQYAIGFAKRFEARLSLLHVIYPQYFVTSGDYMALDYPLLLEETRRTARREMNTFVRSAAFEGVPFDTHIQEGHPGQQIVAYAGKAKADLIVNATHGRTGLGHVLLGSTAEHVVRYGHCPVLVVRSGRGRKSRRR